MARSTIVLPERSTIRRLLLVSSLIVLLGLVLPVTVFAGPPHPDYQGPEKCAECHSAEAEAWQDSPHARAMVDIDDSVQLACGAWLATPLISTRLSVAMLMKGYPVSRATALMSKATPKMV
jgi:hypothetical protein